MKRPLLSTLCALALLLGGTAGARAAQLVGNDFFSGILYDVDPTTGAATAGRPTGLTSLSGIAHRRADGALFGLTAFLSAGLPNALYAINAATGAATLMGATGLFLTEGDLDFDPVTGVLYGVQDLTGGVPQALFTLNTTTGAATLIGGAAPNTDLSAMAFDAAGNLFVLDTRADHLLRLDKNTAAVLGSVVLSAGLGSTAGMDFDPASGTLYVADGGLEGTDSLYTLDTTTGALTQIGSTGLGNGLGGLSFAPPTPSAVPEPGAAFLLASGSLLAGAVFLRPRRNSWATIIQKEISAWAEIH